MTQSPTPTPKQTNRFVLHVPGVESFLVENCILPEFTNSKDCPGTFTCLSELQVQFHSAIEPSTLQQVANLALSDKYFVVVLKQLDAAVSGRAANSIVEYVFSKVKLDRFRITNLSYSTADDLNEKIIVNFRCTNATLNFYSTSK